MANAEIVLNKTDDISLKFIPFQRISVIRDEPDNRFIELGVMANANFLTKGNRNHFKLTEYGTMKIVSPRDYVVKYYK